LLRDARVPAPLHDNGTKRLMIVCGSPACFQTAKSFERNLSRAGLESLLSGDRSPATT